MDKWALYNDKEVNFNFSLMCILTRVCTKKKKKEAKTDKMKREK